MAKALQVSGLAEKQHNLPVNEKVANCKIMQEASLLQQCYSGNLCKHIRVNQEKKPAEQQQKRKEEKELPQKLCNFTDGADFLESQNSLKVGCIRRAAFVMSTDSSVVQLTDVKKKIYMVTVAS